VDAYGLLLHWKKNPLNLMQVLRMNSNGMAFSQEGTETGTIQVNLEKTSKGDKSDITCYNCQKQGHYSNKCMLPGRRNTKSGLDGAQLPGQTGFQLLMA
jgi:hypothetical protein